MTDADCNTCKSLVEIYLETKDSCKQCVSTEYGCDKLGVFTPDTIKVDSQVESAMATVMTVSLAFNFGFLMMSLIATSSKSNDDDVE